MTPRLRNNRADRRSLVLLVLPLAGLVATSCSSGGGSTAAAEAPATALSISPLPPTSATLPPDSVTTLPPTSAEPPTTEATTTTVAETTTTLPPTPTVPSNVEVVGPFEPLQAVGRNGGEATKSIQMRLLQLGFWVSGVDGEYGLTTRQAVMAFQKYLGLEATGSVDESTAAYLTNFTERAHGSANDGDLIEIDKTKQLLFIVRDGKTIWTLNTSTATGLPYEEEDKNSPGEMQVGVSITPDGLWEVNRERPEGWWEGDLGEIYRPKYFRGGVAVHGSNSIPNYPASHGCVRVSVPAMDFIWEQNLLPMGIAVWVHGG